MYLPSWLLALISIFTLLLLYVLYYLGKKIGLISANRFWESKISQIRKETADKSKSIIKGQVAEQFAPYLPEFPFTPSDCHFLGKPVDFIVFNNLNEPEKSSIIFVEVKTGTSKLNQNEKNLKIAIESKRVFWYEYRLK